ncbi:MAG: response regulator [Bryobacterales bacterium]|nr:response regulator [Bryobacterales bacterium]
MSYGQKKIQEVPTVRSAHAVDNSPLKAAIMAAQQGDRKRAHVLLQMACRRDENNEQAWLWRASLTSDLAEATECMKEVLRINRENRIAQQWLARTHEPAAESEEYECPFCGREDTQDFYRCDRCKAVVSLDLELMKELADVNTAILEHAVNGYKQAIPDDPYNSNYWLAVAYLNMFRSELALTHLLEAQRLEPYQKDVDIAVEKLRRRKLILVVDDSVTIRSLVTRVLERNGCRTLEASTGMEALSYVDQKEIAAVVLDIGMPMMDGYKVCRLLREHARTAAIPIIMLSGNDGFFDKVRGKLAGSTDYLTKPLKPNMLMASIHKHVDLT